MIFFYKKKINYYLFLHSLINCFILVNFFGHHNLGVARKFTYRFNVFREVKKVENIDFHPLRFSSGRQF